MLAIFTAYSGEMALLATFTLDKRRSKSLRSSNWQEKLEVFLVAMAFVVFVVLPLCRGSVTHHAILSYS
jgi:hypothetical protein